MIANEGIRENVKKFAIGDRVDSDHMPLMAREEKRQKFKGRGKKARKGDNCMEQILIEYQEKIKILVGEADPKRSNNRGKMAEKGNCAWSDGQEEGKNQKI